MKDQVIIDRYLHDDLSAADRATFEQRLRREPALAEAVRFQRSLQNHFDRETPALEATLTALGNEFFPTPPATAPPSSSDTPDRRWLFLLFLLPLGFLVWWLMPTPQSPPAGPPTISPPTEQPAPPVQRDEVPPTPPALPETLTPPPSGTTKSQPAPERPIAAADYSVNPALEDLMREQLRSETTTLNSPAADAVLSADAPRLTVTGTSKAAPPYTLTLYTNRPAAFDNDYPSLRRELSAVRADAGYTFSFDARLDLTPGRYYLLLQDEAGELLWVRSFRVE